MSQDRNRYEPPGTTSPQDPGAPLAAADAEELLRRQQAVVAMGRRAMAPPERAILLHDAAALIAEMLDAEHSAVAEFTLDRSRLAVRLTLRPSGGAKPRVVAEELSTGGDESLMGYALQMAHPVMVQDLVECVEFVDPFLRRYGIRSALAIPLKLQDRSFGALAACSATPQRFKPEDELFAETIAHLATTTIARSLVERSLVEERQLALGVLQTVGALVLVLNTQGQIVRINRACEQATGFSLAEIKDRLIWNVLHTRDEVGLFRGVLDKLRGGAPRVECESYLVTKHSDRRRIRWSYSALPGPAGALDSIIATGIDITEQQEAEQRAERAEQAVERVRHMGSHPGVAAAEDAQAAKPQPKDPSPEPPATPAPAPFAPIPDPLNKERRRRPRRSYPYRQAIAPILDGKLPPRSAFHDVQCNDIGAGGFGYLSEKPPESDLLVVALGTPPKLTCLIAQVAHVTRTQQSGKTVYLVGCTYTGRAPY